MYNVCYFWNNFKNNLKTLSGWFLTKHPVNKNAISLNPEISVFICGCLLYIKGLKYMGLSLLIYSFKTISYVSETDVGKNARDKSVCVAFLRNYVWVLKEQTFIISRACDEKEIWVPNENRT